MRTHLSLIGVIVFTNDGLTLLKEVMSQFQQSDLEPVRVSSVYQVMGNPKKIDYVHDLKHTDHFFGLSVCVAIKSSLSALEQLQKLKSIEALYLSSLKKKALSLNLLFFNSETKITPQLCLPYADFHNRAEYVIPAAEIWSDYIHPVLNEELRSLTRKFVGKNWGEFFAQSSELLSLE